MDPLAVVGETAVGSVCIPDVVQHLESSLETHNPDALHIARTLVCIRLEVAVRDQTLVNGPPWDILKQSRT